MAAEERPFLSRWSQRKAQARAGVALPEPAPTAEAEAEASTAAVAVPPPVAAAPVAPAAPAAPAPPPPTMADVAALERSSDYSRFVAPGVAPGVRNAAMRKLFSDPHFNVMDGLDIYIDDYSRPDPVPFAMLRTMVQSKTLGLFDDEEGEGESPAAGAAPAAAGAGAPPAGPPASPSGIASPGSPGTDNRRHDEHTDLQLQPDDAAGRAGLDQGTRSGQV